MANQKDIEETYDYMDKFFRLSLGEHADITCAMYNGDFKLSLDEAQEAKHKYILEGVKFKKGDRVLDIGCGWGPVLQVVRDEGGKGVGMTLSPAQAKTCQADGLDAVVEDWKDADLKKIGRFDAVVSVGAFEHFCSVEEYQSGQQEKIYGDFFKLCSDVLDSGSRLYLQTMMWGKHPPDPNTMSVRAPKLSSDWIVGHLAKFYPGTWGPYSLEQIEQCAKPYFKLVSENNGRLDYIQTMKEWGRAMRRPSLRKLITLTSLVPRYLTDKDFRYQLTSLRYGCNRLAFEREIMSHQRMVFEKK